MNKEKLLEYDKKTLASLLEENLYILDKIAHCFGAEFLLPFTKKQEESEEE